MSDPDRTPMATATRDVAVVITCEWCGERVELTEGELGPTVDAQSFLAAHRNCLRQRTAPD